VTGMQTAKLKAEANGRKAKVLIPSLDFYMKLEFFVLLLWELRS
jgi:hypothetical protein